MRPYLSSITGSKESPAHTQRQEVFRTHFEFFRGAGNCCDLPLFFFRSARRQNVRNAASVRRNVKLTLTIEYETVSSAFSL